MQILRVCLIASLACAGVLFTAPQVASAADVSLAQAVNIAGRQRMLTQRIVKAYVQIGQGIAPQTAKDQLSEAVRLFESQLRHLRRIAPDERSRRTIARIEDLWLPFRSVATGAPSRAGAERLLTMDDELVGAAHELTVELQNHTASSVGRLVNIAGRQRMLSQRLAKYYLLRAWGLETPTMGREVASARTEFDGALAALRSAPENTAAINRELEAVALQWEWFRHALGLAGAASYGLIVVNASEAILNSMELVTELYEQLEGK